MKIFGLAAKRNFNNGPFGGSVIAHIQTYNLHVPVVEELAVRKGEVEVVVIKKSLRRRVRNDLYHWRV